MGKGKKVKKEKKSVDYMCGPVFWPGEERSHQMAPFSQVETRMRVVSCGPCISILRM
jgi:hypothetical protein